MTDRLDFDRIVGDRERGLTMAEVHAEIDRHDRERRRRRGRTRSWDQPVEHFTAERRLTAVQATDPEIVNMIRGQMHDEVDHYVRIKGYVVTGVSWRTDPWPTGTTDPVVGTQLRLEAELAARTDGEWPSVRRAVLEDQAELAALQLARLDRLRAKQEAEQAVNDRLDSLLMAAVVWRDPAPFNRLRAP